MSELRLSLQNNAGAYGYSVMITGTLAMVSSVHQSPQPGQIFLFILGAVVSFAFIEATVTRGFARRQEEKEAGEVIALGSSLSIFSIAFAVGVAGLLALVLPENFAWVVSAFGASVTYLFVLGAEMSAARRIEEARRVE